MALARVQFGEEGDAQTVTVAAEPRADPPDAGSESDSTASAISKQWNDSSIAGGRRCREALPVALAQRTPQSRGLAPVPPPGLPLVELAGPGGQQAGPEMPGVVGANGSLRHPNFPGMRMAPPADPGPLLHALQGSGLPAPGLQGGATQQPTGVTWGGWDDGHGTSGGWPWPRSDGWRETWWSQSAWGGRSGSGAWTWERWD